MVDSKRKILEEEKEKKLKEHTPKKKLFGRRTFDVPTPKWFLYGVGILCVVIASYMMISSLLNPPAIPTEQPIFEWLNPENASIMINSGYALTIDLNPDFYYNYSHMNHTIRIPMVLKNNNTTCSPCWARNLHSLLNTKQPYILYDFSGVRTSLAMEEMKKHGFKEIYGIRGGINRWVLEGYPFEQQ